MPACNPRTQLIMKITILTALATLALVLPSCDKIDDALDRRPNEKILDAAEDLGDSVEDAAEGVKDAVNDATN